MPYSIRPKPHVHNTTQMTRPRGRIHHWNPMPVSSRIAIAAPPTSAASSSTSTISSAPSGTTWKWMPNRSRTAAISERLLTPASPPHPPRHLNEHRQHPPRRGHRPEQLETELGPGLRGRGDRSDFDEAADAG